MSTARLTVRAGRARVRITGRMERHALEIAAWGSHRCYSLPLLPHQRQPQEQRP